MPGLRRLGVLTPLFAVLTLPVGILAALFVGIQAAVAVFVVGWLLLVPVSAILFGAPDEEPVIASGDEERAAEESTRTDESEDPIEALRDRYARGEIDEVELERRLEALVEMEDLDADDRAGIDRTLDRIDDGSESTDADPTYEYDRE